jgi:glycolate oxidase
VELDGRQSAVKADLRDLRRLLGSLPHLFIQHALGAEACEQLWQLRREFSYALRDTGLTKLNEDIVVPRGRLEDLFRFTARLQRESGFPVACFGHAGDGNIHVNIMVDFNQPDAEARSRKVLDQLFTQILSWGGVITGEHGVGLAKKQWFPQAVTPAVQRFHQDVKAALDPHGILNPGKFI